MAAHLEQHCAIERHILQPLQRNPSLLEFRHLSEAAVAELQAQHAQARGKQVLAVHNGPHLSKGWVPVGKVGWAFFTQI